MEVLTLPPPEVVEITPDQTAVASSYIDGETAGSVWPVAPRGILSFFLTTGLGCAGEITAPAPAETTIPGICSDSPITVENIDLSETDRSSLEEIVGTDFELIGGFNADLLCGLSSIKLAYAEEGDFDFSYSVDADGATSMTLKFGRDLMAYYHDQKEYSDAIGGGLLYYEVRSWMRYIIFQALGYHVLSTLAVNDPGTFEDFAAYSWQKDENCDASNQIDEWANCWSMVGDVIEDDFLGESWAGFAENLLEDWLRTFALVAVYLTSGISYDYPSAEFIGPTIYDRPGYYSDKGVEKWYWMEDFLAEYQS
ncbi:MAG: hypothetical protein HY541_02925 [Deltaproteobacteria bacterium]|nr:hypothetical protein [Deltaproteobacteria bacterium]